MAMKIATIMAAMGSRTRHCGPRKNAAPTPMRVAIEENASLRWCHALAITASLCIFLPVLRV